ncbi:type VI secretion system membrane subunit TssM [Campylobacter concisus]|jgi:type VI secretion protein icmF|uniref:type VI secretion system membrane subunit TssM n=1 Tax=Campylobacter concisus TaxID=199 RepID=UPI000CD94313|nr:type VI secretion system membrane subunit TssM [Campylobacter concisus]
MAFIDYLRRFFIFFRFKHSTILVASIALSILFWLYAPLIAFNDVYSFASISSRVTILIAFWAVILFFVLIKPLMHYLASQKDEKNNKLKEIKKESMDSFGKAKRNFMLSLKDAKTTWKKDINFKKLPLIMIMGNEGAGKSAFINYSNIEFPLSDSLDTYKKIHKSTTNFNLYISKFGALLDTEGIHFAQESLYQPTATEELPEDDVDKNRDYLLKKSIWSEFLNFLKRNDFNARLSGAVLIIDTKKFLEGTQEYFDELIRYMIKRVNDCEKHLKTKFPIYIVFSKLDLIDGMGDYFRLFNEDVANKALGINLDPNFSKQSLETELKGLSESLFKHLMSKNSISHLLEDKKRSYLFLKQLDNFFALVKDFVTKLSSQNALKNSSTINGIYFVSAYQENIPINYLTNTICDRYNIKKPLLRAVNNYSKQSYFVKSFLKEIAFKANLNKFGAQNRFTKFINFVLVAILCAGVYLGSSFILETKNIKEQNAINNANKISSYLDGKKYKDLSPTQKIELLNLLKQSLNDYPRIFSGDTKFEYITLDTSYKGFTPVKALYYDLNADFFKNTVLTEMENILKNESDPDKLIKAFYMYDSLFDKDYTNVDLFKIWISTNWDKFEKYGVAKDEFLAHIEAILKAENLNITADTVAQSIANTRLSPVQRAQRLYYILEFISFKDDKSFYDIKKDVENLYTVVQEKEAFKPFNKIYTKENLRDFLSKLSSNIDQTAGIESWLMETNSSLKDISSNDKKELSIAVIELYLQNYADKWSQILREIEPNEFSTKKEVIEELDILSKRENPLNSLIKLTNQNTNLNDENLLKYIYSLGFASSEIKRVFSDFSAKFTNYHALNSNDLLDIISNDVTSVYKKVSDYNFEMLQSNDDKIVYAINGIKNENDPFVVLNNDAKKLPDELNEYYQKLSTLAWKQVENGASVLLSTAYRDDVFDDFESLIKPFYPFNEQSPKAVSIEEFKRFFGKNGTWNSFYDKYLKQILSKTADGYKIRPKYAKELRFSRDFLKNIAYIDRISNLMLDSNDELKLNYNLKAVDLSANFSHINISYSNNSLTYDHTIASNLIVSSKNFDISTQFKFNAVSSTGSERKELSFDGEWGWYKILKASNFSSVGVSTLNFDGRRDSYFGFEVTPNGGELLELMDIIPTINLPKKMLY